MAKTPLNKVFPIFSYLCCWSFCQKDTTKQKDSGKKIREHLLDKTKKKKKRKKIKVTVNGKNKRQVLQLNPNKKFTRRPDMANDPLNELGYGIIAYRDTLFTMICGFTIISILALPIMYIYMQGYAYDISGFSMQNFSLGNLGYSSV